MTKITIKRKHLKYNIQKFNNNINIDINFEV